MAIIDNLRVMVCGNRIELAPTEPFLKADLTTGSARDLINALEEAINYIERPEGFLRKVILTNCLTP